MLITDTVLPSWPYDLSCFHHDQTWSACMCHEHACMHVHVVQSLSFCPCLEPVHFKKLKGAFITKYEPHSISSRFWFGAPHVSVWWWLYLVRHGSLRSRTPCRRSPRRHRSSRALDHLSPLQCIESSRAVNEASASTSKGLFHEIRPLNGEQWRRERSFGPRIWTHRMERANAPGTCKNPSVKSSIGPWSWTCHRSRSHGTFWQRSNRMGRCDGFRPPWPWTLEIYPIVWPCLPTQSPPCSWFWQLGNGLLVTSSKSPSDVSDSIQETRFQGPETKYCRRCLVWLLGHKHVGCQCICFWTWTAEGRTMGSLRILVPKS